jgi:hypothetical protein
MQDESGSLIDAGLGKSKSSLLIGKLQKYRGVSSAITEAMVDDARLNRDAWEDAVTEFITDTYPESKLGFVKVKKRLLDFYGVISLQTMAIFQLMASFVTQYSAVTVSTRKLAKVAGLNSPKVVARALAELESYAMIYCIERGTGPQLSTYLLNPELVVEGKELYKNSGDFYWKKMAAGLSPDEYARRLMAWDSVEQRYEIQFVTHGREKKPDYFRSSVLVEKKKNSDPAGGTAKSEQSCASSYDDDDGDVPF